MKKITRNLLLLAALCSVLNTRAQPNANAANPAAEATHAVAAPAATTAAPPPEAATPPATAPATTNAEAAATGPATTPTAEPIPLVALTDVSITTAIEHLARQANINYMLDPKIGYGQTDQNGQTKPEPQLTIRWENITAENALLALLDNYSLQMVVDKKTSIARITIKDPAALPPLITRVIQLQYSSASNMTEAVQSVLTDKRSKVMADARTSQLLIVATDPEQQSADTLLAQLDKPTKQVLIETKLIEISSNPTAKRGVDWSSTLTSQHVTFGNGTLSGVNSITTPGPTSKQTTTTPGGGHTTTTVTQAPSSVVGALSQVLGGGGWSASTMGSLIPATAFLNADGVSAAISFLNASYDAQVYSTPRVVTLDNDTAHIEVIRTYPILSISGGTANASGSSSVTYSNIGTILSVTPRISANENIWIRVEPEVSSHFGDESVTQQGGSAGVSTTFTVPIFDRRKITSEVMIPNGKTLVMGGLVQDSPNATYSTVPFLGDIPGLGWAFKSESKSMTKDNLVIFLTPSIVKDEDFQGANTTFLQTKPRTMRSPMNPHKPWDGAEPDRGWDNPAPMPGEFDKAPALK